MVALGYILLKEIVKYVLPFVLWIFYSSRAPGLTSGLQGSMNVHRDTLLLVPQWQCISSFVFYIMLLDAYCQMEFKPPPVSKANTLGVQKRLQAMDRTGFWFNLEYMWCMKNGKQYNKTIHVYLPIRITKVSVIGKHDITILRFPWRLALTSSTYISF